MGKGWGGGDRRRGASGDGPAISLRNESFVSPITKTGVLLQIRKCAPILRQPGVLKKPHRHPRHRGHYLSSSPSPPAPPPSPPPSAPLSHARSPWASHDDGPSSRDCAGGRPAPSSASSPVPLCFGPEHSLVLPKFPEMMPVTSSFPTMIYFKMPPWLGTSSPRTFQETLATGCEDTQRCRLRTRSQKPLVFPGAQRRQNPTLTLTISSPTCNVAPTHWKAPNKQGGMFPRPAVASLLEPSPRLPGRPNSREKRLRRLNFEKGERRERRRWGDRKEAGAECVSQGLLPHTAAFAHQPKPPKQRRVTEALALVAGGGERPRRTLAIENDSAGLWGGGSPGAVLVTTPHGAPGKGWAVQVGELTCPRSSRVLLPMGSAARDSPRVGLGTETKAKRPLPPRAAEWVGKSG